MKRAYAFFKQLFRLSSAVTDQKIVVSKIDFHQVVKDVKDFAIVMYDANGIVISWNNGVESMSGFKAEDVIGKSFENFYTDEDKKNGIPWQILNKTRELGHYEINGRRLRKNGDVGWANIIYTALKNDAGELYGYLVIIRDITASKKIQDQLELFSKQINQSNDSIYTIDTNYKITSWNKGAEKLYGFTEEEALGKISNELLDTVITKEDLSAALNVIDKEGHWAGELKRKTKAGEEIYVRSSTSNIRDAEGTITGFIGVSFDITAQKKLERQVTHLASIVEQSTDAIRSIGLDHRIITWNKGCEKMHGYTKEEAIGKTSLELGILDRTVEQSNDFFKRILQDGAAKSEVKFYHKDKTAFFGIVTASIIKNEDGGANSIVFNIKDISERKQLEEQLIKSNEQLEQKVKERTAEIYKTEKRFRALVENNQAIISLLDEKFSAIYVSPASDRITGWTLEERKKKAGFETAHPDDLETHRKMAKNVLENPGKTFNIKTRVRHKDGHYIWLEGVITNMLHDSDVGGITSNLIDITERIQAEEAISKSELLYRSLFQNMLQGFAYCKAIFENGRLTDGIYLAVNNEYEKQKNVKNITGKKMSEVMPHLLEPESIFPAIITGVALGGNSTKLETYLKSLGKWLSLSLYSPEKEYFVCLIDDVTERRQTEEAIHKSEILYRSLFENMLHGFATCKPIFENAVLKDLVYVTVNNEYEKLTGFKDIAGKKLSVIMPGLLESDPVYVKKISSVLSTGNPEKFEYFIPQIGKWFLSSIYRPDKEHFVLLVDNITERKTAEETIRKSELLYRNLFENMLHGFAYCQPIFDKEELVDLTYITVNTGYELITGIKNAAGKKMSELLPGVLKSDPLYASRIKRVVLSGKPEKFEVYIQPLDKWFFTSLYSIDKEYFVALVDDITERRQVEEKIRTLNEELEERVVKRTEQLKKSNEDLEAFSYSVSHDLRAPLRGITGFASILEEDYADKLDDEAKRITAVIKNSAVKMGRLIDDLLSFSRMGRKDILKTVFDPAEIVHDIISEMNLQESNINWIIHPLPQVKADMITIRQVWINLISNAIKYSGKVPAPRIEIGSFRKQKQVVFFVKDNGTGFDEKYKNKLFGVFQRLHSQDEFEGSGIGLAIVAKIISKHDGKVWAEAEVNKGASFYFSLPAFR